MLAIVYTMLFAQGLLLMPQSPNQMSFYRCPLRSPDLFTLWLGFSARALSCSYVSWNKHQLRSPPSPPVIPHTPSELPCVARGEYLDAHSSFNSYGTASCRTYCAKFDPNEGRMHQPDNVLNLANSPCKLSKEGDFILNTWHFEISYLIQNKTNQYRKSPEICITVRSGITQKYPWSRNGLKHG